MLKLFSDLDSCAICFVLSIMVYVPLSSVQVHDSEVVPRERVGAEVGQPSAKMVVEGLDVMTEA